MSRHPSSESREKQGIAEKHHGSGRTMAEQKHTHTHTRTLGSYLGTWEADSVRFFVPGWVVVSDHGPGDRTGPGTVKSGRFDLERRPVLSCMFGLRDLFTKRKSETQ